MRKVVDRWVSKSTYAGGTTMYIDWILLVHLRFAFAFAFFFDSSSKRWLCLMMDEGIWV